MAQSSQRTAQVCWQVGNTRGLALGEPSWLSEGAAGQGMLRRSVPLGAMLPGPSPPEPNQPARPARRSESPKHPGAGLFSVSSCGFLPGRAQESVSATPELPRVPAAIPAGLT